MHYHINNIIMMNANTPPHICPSELQYVCHLVSKF